MANWYWNHDTGNDSTGDGSSSNPWKTLHYAISQASAGDYIYPTGDFTDESDATGGYGIRCPTALTVDCTGYTVIYKPTSSAINMLFDLTGGATIKYLQLDGDSLSKTGAHYYGFYVNSNDVTLENCSIDNLDYAGQASGYYNYGIYVNGKTGLTIDALTITDLGSTATALHYWLYGHTGSQAYIKNSSLIYTGGHDSDAVLDWSVGDAVGRTLTVEDTLMKCTGTHTNPLSHMASGQVLFNRCTLWDTQTGSTQGALASASIATSSARVFTAQNCVFVGPNCVNLTGSTGSYTLENNIYVPTVDTSGTFAVRFADQNCENAGTLDYNQYWVQGSNTEYGIITGVGDYATFAAWKTATGQDANSQDGTPTFTDYSGGDFTLQSTSACINQGVFVGNPYTGSAPDIGRYEYQVSVDAGVGIGQLDRNDGTKQMLVVVAGTLYEYDPATDTNTPIGGGFTPSDTNYWSLVSFADKMYALTSAEALHVWSGDAYTTGTVTVTRGSTTVTGSGTDFDGYLGADGYFKVDDHGLWHRHSAATTDTNLTLATAYMGPSGSGLSYTASTYKPAAGSPPTGKVLVKWDNRLWITGNATNPRRVYYSALNNGESWDTTNDYLTTADAPVSLVPMEGYMLVFGRDQAWVIQPYDQVDTPYAVTSFTNIGVMSHQSVAVAGSLIFGLTEEGVRMIDGGENPIISDPIQGDLLALEKSRWKYSFGIIDKPNHRFLLLMTSNGGTQHDRIAVYDYLFNRWDGIDTLGVNFNCIGIVEDSDDVPHIYGLGYDGKVYEYETTATQDDGTDIAYAIASGIIDFGDPTHLKRLMEVAVDAEPGYTSVDLEHLPDGVAAGSGTTSTLTAANSTAIAGGRDRVSAFPQAQNIAGAFRFRLTHTAAETFECHGIGVGIIPLEGEDS